MNTWISDRLLAFGLCLGLLAGCDGASPAISLFGAGSSSNDETAASVEVENTALARAEMLRGALTLVPPDGFCIDSRGLTQRFAVMARCDTLGGKGGALDAPVGFVTVSLAPVEGAVDTSELIDLAVPEGAERLEAKASDLISAVRLRGGATGDVDPVHWRGLARIGPALVAASVFGPDGGRVTGNDGFAILEGLAQETWDASVAAAVARKSELSPNPKQKGLRGLISGLFE